MSEPNVEIAGKTHPGCVRDRNEDSIALDSSLGLLVVADGMGGHNSGEVASGLATESILKGAREMLGGDKPVEPPEGEAALSRRARLIVHLVTGANSEIFTKAQAFPKDHGMGTTVVAALIDERSITVGHVGDSRLYLLRKGGLRLLTEDHSLVMDQVKRGLLTMEQAEKSSLQNILTRALGTEAGVGVDVQDHDLLPGDVVMACSDGLTKMVTEAEAATVLRECAKPEEAVDRLIKMACDAGGVDNVTVAVARVAADGEETGGGFFARLFGG